MHKIKIGNKTVTIKPKSIMDNAHYYNSYKKSIEKANKNNDVKLFNETKQSIMYAPSTKLSGSEATELWKMVKNSPLYGRYGKDSSITDDYTMEVETYIINKGQPTQYYGLKNKKDNQVLHSAPNNWKTEQAAIKWAKQKGYKIADRCIKDKAQLWLVRSVYGAKEYRANSESDAVKMYLKNYPKAKIDDITIQLIKEISSSNHTAKLISQNMDSISKEALQKNIKTEIEASKDPKQAAAIAYDIKRKNDGIISTAKQIKKDMTKAINKDESVKNIKASYAGSGWKIQKDGKTYIVQNYADRNKRNLYEVVDMSNMSRLLENASKTEVKKFTMDIWGVKLLDGKQYTAQVYDKKFILRSKDVSSDSALDKNDVDYMYTCVQNYYKKALRAKDTQATKILSTILATIMKLY